MIFAPRHLVRIGIEIWAGDVVVRSDLGAAKAAEIAFRLIGANAFVHERNRVIDAARIPTGVKRIPTGAFISINSRKCADAIASDRASVTLIGDHKRKRATLALAHDYDALALVRPVRFQAAVLRSSLRFSGRTWPPK